MLPMISLAVFMITTDLGFLWYTPGATIMAAVSVLLIFITIKLKDFLFLISFAINTFILMAYSAPLLLA